MALKGKIRALREREGKSISEIARRTSLSRDTIKKWLRAPADAQPKYRRQSVASKLTPFVETITQALKADAHRPRHERRSARALLSLIQAQGYDGGYSRLTDFIRAWRQGEGQAVTATAFVPLKFELGDAFQFDWSEEGLVVGGIYYRVQVAHLKLCASRAFWLVAYPSQGHEMLFDAHTRAFAALGGIPRRGIYDNMKTAVDKVKKGKGRIVNARFAVMCNHYLYDPDFCNVASGWEKGVVEKNVQDSRRRIWIEASERRFGSFVELNAWLAERCRSLWADLRHPEHKQFSVAEMLELEQPHLMPMPEPLIQLQRALMRRQGGDRVMAQVLAAVPTAGLEAVLVAVSLVLESGAVSAEHVLNVLARLNASPAPEQVETALKLSEPPKADAGRYDSLRTGHTSQEDHHA